MFFRTTAVLLSVALHSISTGALPTSTRGASLTARDENTCPAGTSFYVCYINNFRGCCSVDPCAMEAGCPDSADNEPEQPEQPTQPTCKDGLARVYMPTMHTIDAANPRSRIETTDIDLTKSAKKTTMQTMTFKLPSEAVGKDCLVNWGMPAERDFTVVDGGVVDVIETTDGLSEKVGAANFENWPETEGPKDMNVVGSTECKEQLDFLLSLRNEGSVFMAQNEETGWFVQYKC